MDFSKIDNHIEGDYAAIERVAAKIKEREPTDFSAMNRNSLRQMLVQNPTCRVIVEIGVENNPDKNLTSTAIFLKNKRPGTYYFGIDILDRSHLNDSKNNVYTIRGRSEDRQVLDVIRHVIKREPEIDFLFIDGWHSIHQCRMEWETYSPFVSKTGIVGFHDVNHHYGPAWLAQDGIDKIAWNVTVDHGRHPDLDFGIGFAWRR